jgi:heterodisulfide reductase subunit A-like polyferredoxin
LHCGLCSECGLCIAACSAGAIDLAQAPSELEIEVGGVIVAPEETEAPAWKELAARIGLDPDIPGLPAEPVRTRLPGVYAAGGRGREIAAAVTRGSAAAACAMEQLASVRGTLARPRSYPWERDVTDEEARIGVFVCRCGHQVARAVDVAEVCRSVSALEGVRCVEALEYSCSDSGLRRIKRRIGEHRLNRVVVASCSSRTYEALFQEVLRESGLNRYLLATANIREECAWVHGGDGGATRKAVDLVAMAAARARHLRPLPPVGLPVTASALVLGGGRSGMTAALSLAGQGFGVHLVERSGALGGGARRPGPGEGAAGDRVSGLVDRVTAHPGITLHLDSELAAIAGQAGDFTCRLTVSGWGRVTLAAGAVIVATGPGGENGALAAKLRVALGEDGGFRPAHPVLRPVDLVNEGQFFCTAAHPSPVQERVLRALAAASRAATILSKPQLEIAGHVASVNPLFCVACGTCVQLCPYGAPVIGEGRKAAVQGVKCAGCGSCVACCPRRAITLRREESGTVTAMLDQLMAAGGGY